MSERELRAGIRGAAVALPGRIEPWQESALSDFTALNDVVEQHGSPVNLHSPDLLAGHARELVDAGASLGVTTKVFFARKANKTLALVRAALKAGHGVDVASLAELEQVLAMGAPADRIIVTAAVKSRALLQRCVDAGVPVSLDNADELQALASFRTPTPVALRLRGESPVESRFGLPQADWVHLAASGDLDGLLVQGIHVHLSGYAAADRSTALGQAIGLVDALADQGFAIEWIDIGGAFRCAISIPRPSGRSSGPPTSRGFVPADR